MRYRIARNGDLPPMVQAEVPVQPKHGRGMEGTVNELPAGVLPYAQQMVTAIERLPFSP